MKFFIDYCIYNWLQHYPVYTTVPNSMKFIDKIIFDMKRTDAEWNSVYCFDNENKDDILTKKFYLHDLKSVLMNCKNSKDIRFEYLIYYLGKTKNNHKYVEFAMKNSFDSIYEISCRDEV